MCFLYTLYGVPCIFRKTLSEISCMKKKHTQYCFRCHNEEGGGVREMILIFWCLWCCVCGDGGGTLLFCDVVRMGGEGWFSYRNCLLVDLSNLLLRWFIIEFFVRSTPNWKDQRSHRREADAEDSEHDRPLSAVSETDCSDDGYFRWWRCFSM